MTAKSDAAKIAGRFFLVATVALLVACGGGGSNQGENGGGGVTPVNNVQAVSANQGPANNFVNGLFTSVTICVPGTTNCQTIPNIEIDTGSEGLRLLASQVTLSLPPVNDNTSNQLQECVQFADGSYIWGPIVTADIQMAGEKGASNSVQLIPNPSPLAVPSTCASAGGANLNTLSSLGANGIIGLGVFQQDCGPACAPNSTQVPASYYLCPNTVCSPATVPLLLQLQDPVWTFPQDNNGFQITMPALQETGAVSVSGSMIFGIGTQTNNTLGTAKIYTAFATGPDAGNFHTTYNSISYPGFIDSGSNGYYMLDALTLGQGMADCTTSGFSGFYCPAATTTFTMTNTGVNGTAGSVTFRIGNAVTLLSANNSSNWVFDDLGGPNSGMVDFGMPFFYGRTVFIGIEGQSGPGGAVGPYWAF
jgi:uncharacterized protein DUF3443